MGLFNKIFNVTQKTFSKTFAVSAKINGVAIRGIISDPSLLIDPKNVDLSSVMQKKILEIDERSLKACEGDTVEIDNEVFFVIEIYRDSYKNAKLILERGDNVISD